MSDLTPKVANAVPSTPPPVRRLSAALLALATLATAPAHAQTVWHAATEYPATAMPGEGLATFARLLAERTGNQVQLQPAYDGPGGLRSATIPAAVESGQLQVGDAFAGTLTALGPVFQLSSLPFLATTQDQAWQLYQAARPAYAQAYAAHGQRLLYATPWPNSGIWSRDPLPNPAALQGLPIRTYDTTSTTVLRHAGAAAVEYSFADVMPHLKDGSVTAVLSSGDGGAGRKLWDYTRNFTIIGYAMPLSFTTVANAAYDSLSPTQRAAVDQAAKETEAAQWHALVGRTAQNQARMRDNGVVIAEAATPLKAALTQAAQPVIQQWRATAGDAAKVLDAYKP